MKRIILYLNKAFGFSKTEARGFMVLIFICVAVNIFPLLKPYFSNNADTGISEEDSTVFNLFLRDIGHSMEKISDKESLQEPFNWDPNKTSYEELIRLGFAKKVAGTLINFRNAGGIFRAKEDLLKVYGLDTLTYSRLSPYVTIPEHLHEKSSLKKAVKSISVIDINKADSLALTNLKGIGPVFSSRIIKYRNLLGGYANVQQLHEVYGLDSLILKSILDQVKVSSDFTPSRINVNTASYEVLRKHPYIDASVSRRMVARRTVHGTFKNLDELKAVFRDEKVWVKAMPYLSLTD